MALKSGLAGQIMFGEESTVGTGVTPTFGFPLVEESITHERERLESSAAITNRRVIDSDQWNGGNHTIGGPVGFELYNRGLTTLFKHMFGSISTQADTPSSGIYRHTITPGDIDGKGLTTQVGRPGTGGTVHPFTFPGSKFPSWEIACSQGEIATLGLDLSAMSSTTGTALATQAIASDTKPLKFNHASLSVGGSNVPVTAVTLSGDNGLNVDRRFLGSQTVSEQLEAGMRTYEGSFDCEFVDLTLYNLFVNGTESALVLDFTSDNDKVTITLNARFDGGDPALSGPEILTQSIPFKAIGDGSDADAITVVLENADAG